jgi:hypothetical protein
MQQTRRTDVVIAEDVQLSDRPQNEPEEDTPRYVIAAYTAALRGSEEMRRRAFDAALRAYRMRHPAVSEVQARRRVAQILCFANT